MHTARPGLASSSSAAVAAAVLVLLAPAAGAQDAGVPEPSLADPPTEAAAGPLQAAQDTQDTQDAQHAQDAQDAGDAQHAIDDPCDESRSDAGRRAVRVTVWETSDETRELEGVIRELLDHLPVVVCATQPRPVDREVVVQRRESAAPALARVLLGRSRRHIELYVVDGPWERVVARRLELGRFGVDAVTREQVGQIVLTTTEALLAGRPIGQRREELARQEPVSPPSPPREESPPPPAPAPTARGEELHVAPSYAVRLQGSVPLAHEPGLVGRWIGPGETIALTIGGTISYGWRHTAGTNDVRVVLSGVRALVDVGAAVFLGRTISLEPAVGAGIETTFARPEVLGDAALSARAPSSHPRLIGTGSLALRFRPTAWSSVLVGLDVAVSVEDVRYVLQHADAERVVADPWSIRPGAFLAFGFAI